MSEAPENVPELPADAGRRSSRGSAADVNARLTALPELPHAKLRAEWRRVYRCDPPKKIGRDVLELGVAWKLQERTHGGISATVKSPRARARDGEQRGRHEIPRHQA